MHSYAGDGQTCPLTWLNFLLTILLHYTWTLITAMYLMFSGLGKQELSSQKGLLESCHILSKLITYSIAFTTPQKGKGNFNVTK